MISKNIDMKKIFFLIGLFAMLFACSDNEDRVTTDTIVQKPLSLERIKEAVQDSVGLIVKDFAKVYTCGDTLGGSWGCKLGRFWCCLFDISKDDEINIIEEYLSRDILRDTFPIVLGYGKELTFILSENSYSFTRIWQYNTGTFLCQISTFLNDVSVFGLIFSSDGNLTYHVGWKDGKEYGNFEWVQRLWVDGCYVISRAHGVSAGNTCCYIVDAKGNDICQIENDILLSNEGMSSLGLSVTPVSLYDFVLDEPNIESISLSRCSVNKHSSGYAWKIDLPIGKVINDHAPKITYKTEFKGDVFVVDACAVNYDGSREVKKYEIDINVISKF